MGWRGGEEEERRMTKDNKEQIEGRGESETCRERGERRVKEGRKGEKVRERGRMGKQGRRESNGNVREIKVGRE